MRRPLLVGFGLVVFACLVAASNGAAAQSVDRYLRGGEESAVLDHGRGVAALSARGGVLFVNVWRGKVRITDLQAGPRTTVERSGWERRKKVNARTTVYWGRDMGFGVYGGRWRVRINGRGINASARMRGSLGLVGTSGTYSLRDGPERDWPSKHRIFRLG